MCLGFHGIKGGAFLFCVLICVWASLALPFLHLKTAEYLNINLKAFSQQNIFFNLHNLISKDLRSLSWKHPCDEKSPREDMVMKNNNI